MCKVSFNLCCLSSDISVSPSATPTVIYQLHSVFPVVIIRSDHSTLSFSIAQVTLMLTLWPWITVDWVSVNV